MNLDIKELNEIKEASKNFEMADTPFRQAYESIHMAAENLSNLLYRTYAESKEKSEAVAEEAENPAEIVE